MKDSIVGIDSCGTNMRVAAFSETGKLLYITSRKNTPFVDGDQYYFDWKYQRGVILEMLREVVRRGYRILSIGISSCGEAVYPIDKQSNVIDNAIAWYSRTTVEQQKEFGKKAPEMEVYGICFLKPFFSYSAHKINWYKKNKPEVFKSAKCWLSVDGFLNLLLSGTKYFTYNQAGTTLLLDTRKLEWSKRLFELNGIPIETFPELIESGKLTGHLSTQIKDSVGIRYDVPVSLAGHDAWCGQFALGMGVSKRAEKLLLTTTGTAGGVKRFEILDMAKFNRLLNQKGAKYFYNTFGHVGVIPYVYPGKYYCLYEGTTLDYYGSLVDFATKLFYGRAREDIANSDYRDMQRQIETSKPGASGIRIYVAQNVLSRTRRLEGINIMNLSLQSTRGDVLRAIIEYLSLMDLRQIEKTQRNYRMCVVGGLVKNRSYLTARAGIMNKPQLVPDNQEINALGAALLGAIGGGLYSSYEDAVDSVEIHFEEIPVNQQLVAEYSRAYGIRNRSLTRPK